MDQDYQRYLNSYVRWSKFFCDVVCWFAVGFLASVILEFYVTYETCNVLNTGLSGETIENTEAAQAMSQELCSARIGFHSWAIAWLVYPVLRIPFLIRQSGPMMKIMGLRFVRENGQKWTLMNVVTYGFIEWLPAFLGALYVLLVGFTFSLFAGTVYFTIVIGAQLIWLAPVLFIRNGRNLAEIITGITVRATDKKLKKIERGYYSKFYYSVNKFMFGLTWVFYFLVLGICTFSFIQILRVPPQNPAYQEMVYGGYNLVWENNIYFAMAGVSAPADVTDFYQYGFRKSYGYFKYYESLKREMGIKTPYLNEIPKLKGLSFGIDQDREFKLFEQKTKNFECLWALEPKITPDCATFADWLAFIEKNKIVWDRYNRVPDMGTVYVTPPAILGGNIRNIANLGGLKNVHIIYLAKNGKPDEAMKEWLRYMKLYRMMANDREMIVFKALIAVNIGRHLSVLEHLLTIAPELAAKYESNIIQVLNNDQPIYRDPSLLSDDWGLIEPFAGGGIGNVNAIQNDLFECFLSAKNWPKRRMINSYTDKKIFHYVR